MAVDEERARLTGALEKFEEEALYNAQANFEEAASKSAFAKHLTLALSIVSGIAASMVVLGTAPKWGIISIIANTVIAAMAALGTSTNSSKHEVAGKNWTQLRHEASALASIEGPKLDIKSLTFRVNSIAERHRVLVATSPLTSNKSFEKAREKIQSGRFLPDEVTSGSTPVALPESNSSEGE